MVRPVSSRVGLSPRGRGNRYSGQSGFHRWERRSIPAWAGKPALADRTPGLHWVYPRVGWETSPVQVIASPVKGLSPRGRGNRRRAVGNRHRQGSIPAWAGKPASGRVISPASKVYPRVGGETAVCPTRIPSHRDGSIPAWAGKPG